jgi:ligand-binding sensor domain-containing protein
MRIVFVYLLLLFGNVLLAQPSTLYFRNLSTGNGLSHNKVNCITQDQRGFTWLGTDDGLNRYDGYRFEIFRHDPANPATISGNMITDLLEDKAGVLWIATADGGLTKYDYRLPPTRQFRQFKHSASDTSSIPVNIINALVEDSAGYLWLATSGHGVLRFDKTKEIFAEPVRRRSRTYLDLTIGSDGKIWAGRQGGGLIKIDPHTLSYEEDPRYNDVYAGLPYMTVASIFKDSKNNMWIGSWDKVIYMIDMDKQ